jgi:CheY-like chemotaxis protein
VAKTSIQQNKTEALAAELARKNEEQKEMFAIIGHELRTPVAAISMLSQDESMTPDEKIHQVRDISDNLLHVLEDLRVVVSPERALIAKQDMSDPVRILKRALSPLQPLVKERGIELSLETTVAEGVLFSFSSQQFRQCVTNLVKNAAIHSGGKHIYLQYTQRGLDERPVECCLRVQDDGKGIPPELQSKVFEAFGRGDTSQDGTGLGLFIVKQLAEQMGGHLTYSKSQYGGACFELVFSMAEADTEAQAQAQAQAQSISLEGLRILLAEDDTMLRMLTERTLGNKGASVTSFENAYLALQEFEEKDYDLILTDLMMPQMDGHEFTKALRQRGVRIPIIGVTAAVLGEETSDWLNDGASGFIAKPISPEKLTSALAKLNTSEFI